MAQTNFRRKDMIPAAPNRGNAEAIEQPADEEPRGDRPLSASDVLSRVGDNKQLAQEALDTEKKNATPRKGLTASLEEILKK